MRRETKGISFDVVWLVISFMFLGTATLAADERPVVAVFDVQSKFIKLSKARRNMLTELLGQELGVGGVYQVMPPGDVKRALLEQSTESYKECYDEKCQIALGRQLPANKLVTTTVMKVGGTCRVASSLYDLRRQTTDMVGRAKGSCREADLVNSIEQVAAQVRAYRTGGGAEAGFVEEDLGEKPAGGWEVGGGDEVIVEFSSEPSGALVLVDGKMVCRQTPCSKSVTKGRRLVSMQAARYKESKRRIAIKSGTKVNLKLTPNFGWLTVRSEPSGLAVKVNNKDAGTTPIERQEREPGIYRVLVTSQCHYDAGKKVKIGRGKEQMVDVKLKAKQGAIRVRAKGPKGNDLSADVFVDGKNVGRTPGTFKVSVCSKELLVKNKKHGATKKSLSIKERKVTSVEVKLEGGASGLKWIYSRPAGIEFSKTEVTVGQYRACVEVGKCTQPRSRSENKDCNWGHNGRDSHPINCVDWNQSKSFCEWAGGRLPTEDEWYAEASNGGKRKYPWGNESPTCEYCVMNEGGFGCGKNSTWPVCSKPAGNSVSGLCDMSGNLWEWTKTPAGSSRVLRGGSWGVDSASSCRASSRGSLTPGYRNYLLGFRCARLP